MDLTKLSLIEAKDLIHKKHISSKELIESHIKAIEDSKILNAYISIITLEQALKQANISDNMQQKKRALEGLPIGIKDNFCTQGFRTTAGSKALSNFIAPYNATVYEKLCLEAGAIMLGKCNMDDFALGGSNKTSAYGYCINPWRKNNNPNEDLIPGGSSGGSASVVAANTALAATGSDTGGSIRQPASLCGVVGIKPTYGLISRWGLIAFASSLDTVGSINKNVSDAALMLEIMAGYDCKDPTSLNVKIPHYIGNINKGIKGLKIGIPANIGLNASESINKNIQYAKDIITNLDAKIIDISIDNMKYALNVYYIIAPSEGFSNFAQYDGIKYGYQELNCSSTEQMCSESRHNSLGDEVKRRIMIGAFILSSASKDIIGENIYEKALKVRQMIYNEFCELFKTVDAIIIPTTYDGATGINEKVTEIDMYMSDFYTVVANIIGIPSISIPMTLNNNGLPTSIQIMGKNLSEETILQIAYAIEQQAQFNYQPSEWWKK